MINQTIPQVISINIETWNFVSIHLSKLVHARYTRLPVLWYKTTTHILLLINIEIIHEVMYMFTLKDQNVPYPLINLFKILLPKKVVFALRYFDVSKVNRSILC